MVRGGYRGVSKYVPWSEGVIRGVLNTYHGLRGGYTGVSKYVPWSGGVIRGVLNTYHGPGGL